MSNQITPADRAARRRAYLLLVGGLVVSVLVVGSLLLVFGGSSSKPKPKYTPYTVSSADLKIIKADATGFTQTASNFGVRPSAATTATIDSFHSKFSVNQLSVFLSRENVYSILKSKYIAPDSSLDFATLNWNNSTDLYENFETVSGSNYAVGSTKGSIVGGEPQVTVQMTYDAQVVTRKFTRTYYLVWKEIHPANGTITFTKAGGRWLVSAAQFTPEWAYSIVTDQASLDLPDKLQPQANIPVKNPPIQSNPTTTAPAPQVKQVTSTQLNEIVRGLSSAGFPVSNYLQGDLETLIDQAYTRGCTFSPADLKKLTNPAALAQCSS